VDCLTLWLSNCLADNCWDQERDALIALWPELKLECILVSNEVGSGEVPLGPLSRTFVDESGRLHQQLAQSCDSVQLVVAGLALTLK
jgi:adenosylcobinamide kinase/adenosylcobinamide-phosphate guanylyltransferase